MFKNEAHGTSDTVIGPSVRVEGDVVSQGNIQVDGAVSGTIETAANLAVGEQAKLAANVKAQNAYLAGHLKGNLLVQERLELAATAKVDGDITAKVLVMAEGAQLNGRCQMGTTTPASIGAGSGRSSKKTSAVTEAA